MSALHEKTPVASGNLKGSYQMSVFNQGNALVLDITADRSFLNVVDGRGKNLTPPPVDSIREWMRHKGLDQEYAYAVAKKIGKDGIEPRDLFEGLDINTMIFQPMVIAMGSSLDETVKEWGQLFERNESTN